MNIKYLLAIDGGGTKTLAKLINTDSAQEYTAQAGAASIYNDFDGAVDSLQQVITHLCKQSGATPEQILAVMGLAGGSSTQLVDRVKAVLKRVFKLEFAKLNIVSDAHTSLYGANLGEPCVVIALGTGAVGARLGADGSTKIVAGWGFPVDDFGGGARLGLHGVHQLLEDIDRHDGPTSKLTKQLSEQIGDNRSVISSWLRDAKAGDYARFSPLIFSLQKQCPVADSVLAKHIQDVTQLIEKSRDSAQLPTIVIGGLGDVSVALLDTKIQQSLSFRRGDSLTGAAILAAIEYDELTNKGHYNEL
ncbi:MAG: BadF/BadG/BcrA/BcrD ATPase family protein [Pseudoalteromonas sp.]